MQDITNLVESAAANRGNWTTALFESALARMSERSGFSSDWDRGAGEDAGRILCDDKVVAILFRELPLAIVLSDWEHAILDSPSQYDLVVVVVCGLEAPELSLDFAIAKQYFHSFGSRLILLSKAA